MKLPADWLWQLSVQVGCRGIPGISANRLQLDVHLSKREQTDEADPHPLCVCV